MDQKKIAVVILTIALFLSACQPDQNPAKAVVIDPIELQAFADTFFVEQMEKLHIPGVSFVFVQDGEVVYASGYGYANLETGASINTDSSVVRIGSVSKPFVATAVMQLVEQGVLDLHTDINQYLAAFQLESTFSEPVTLAHLLTHTSGFQDPPYVTYTDAGKVQPLGPFLAANMPSPTEPPNTHTTDAASPAPVRVIKLSFRQTGGSHEPAIRKYCRLGDVHTRAGYYQRGS